MTPEIKLLLCRDCGKHRFPDVSACAFCFSTRADQVESKGRGMLWSFTVAHRTHPEMAKDLPFAVGIVELDESRGALKMLGRLVEQDLDAIKIGQRVELVASPEGSGYTTFRPASK